MTENFASLVGLLRPFGDAAEEAGFDVEIKLREQGKTDDRLTYRTGAFAQQDLHDDDDDRLVLRDRDDA